MYRVIYDKAAIKGMRKMPSGIREKMETRLLQIAQDPYRFTGYWKPLTGSPFWRLRVGDYRAICDIQDNELVLLVIKAGPRGGIYK